jgi:dCMP deaminase
MKQKFVDAYMDVAERFAKLSSAKRLQVGAIIVKDDRIISIGYNGMPSGWTNDCEETEFVLNSEIYQTPEEMEKMGYQRTDKGNWHKSRTKPEVIHAEANAIAKLAKGSESGDGSVMFLTHSPCIECAKQIYTAGIKKVYFKNHYRNTQGINFLEKCNVEVVEYE